MYGRLLAGFAELSGSKCCTSITNKLLARRDVADEECFVPLAVRVLSICMHLNVFCFFCEVGFSYLNFGSVAKHDL